MNITLDCTPTNQSVSWDGVAELHEENSSPVLVFWDGKGNRRIKAISPQMAESLLQAQEDGDSEYLAEACARLTVL